MKKFDRRVFPEDISKVHLVMGERGCGREVLFYTMIH